MANLKKKIIREEEVQYFNWMTSSWASFTICPITKGNKIIEVHIVPFNQPNAKNYFVITKKGGWEGFDFGHLLVDTYMKAPVTADKLLSNKLELQFPIISTTHYCIGHRTFSFNMLVPKYSRSFNISTGLEKCCFNWE